MVEIVNDASEFKITLDDAVTVLTREKNKNYVPGHPYMNSETVPKIDDFEPFYVYGENLRMNLLGRAMADQQHVTWGAGTHSSTPVILGAFGPAHATKRFGGMLHATDVGKGMIELITSESPAAR